MGRKESFIQHSFRYKPYLSLTISATMVLISGTLVYHFVEGWRILDSLYFSVITLTTIGYGDFSPQTDFGKIFTIFYVLVGVGIILGFVNAGFDHRRVKAKKRYDEIKEIRERRNTRDKK